MLAEVASPNYTKLAGLTQKLISDTHIVQYVCPWSLWPKLTVKVCLLQSCGITVSQRLHRLFLWTLCIQPAGYLRGGTPQKLASSGSYVCYFFPGCVGQTQPVNSPRLKSRRKQWDWSASSHSVTTGNFGCRQTRATDTQKGCSLLHILNFVNPNISTVEKKLTEDW